MDLTEDFDTVSEKLGREKFRTIICFSVLEHCPNPFKMCGNISSLLDNEGIVFISVPFSWRIHGYPSDYWRFTPAGIRLLFPELQFEAHDGHLSTCKIGETGPINNYMLRADLDISRALKSKQYGYLSGIFIFLCRKFRILPMVFDYPYLFPPVMINMIGKKK